jgi:Protein of unknown function (DUF1194).
MRAEDVDVALVLAVDVSRSMSMEELGIQRDGYASAISHPDVVSAIRQGAHGRIAVAMFEWAADFSQDDIFGWTIIESQADADRLAQIIREKESARQSRTSISGAIRRGVELLAQSPHRAYREVIDISGDGPNNQGQPVLEARRTALDKGIVINGLPLMTQGGAGSAFNIAGLDAYYADCVIGGPGAFIVPVNAWEQFAQAVRRKLVMEIGTREPERPVIVPAKAPAGETDCLIGEKVWQNQQWLYDGR